jgi:hypothetical protein
VTVAANFALLLLVSAGLSEACERHNSASTFDIKARAGVFFGGQLQNRSEWPLMLDAARQNQGFRLDFRHALRKPAHVAWEVIRPSAQSKKHGMLHTETVTSTFDATVSADTNRFDQLIPFSETDRPGAWKLRVFVNGVLVMDKSVQVVTKPNIAGDD